MKTTQTLDTPTAVTARPVPRAADLALILLGELFLLALIAVPLLLPSLAPWLAPLRLLLGLAYVLYAPGYLLQALLFSRLDDLDGIERLGLSLGLSIALVSLLALLLDRLPGGISFWPIVFWQSLLILLLCLAVLARRWLSPAPVLRPRAAILRRSIEPLDRWLYLFVGVALLLASFTAAWVFLVPSPAEFITEFYTIGKEGLAEDYPRQAQLGETINVTLGITNHERTPQDYRLEIWQVDTFSDRRQLAGQLDTFTLPVGKTLQWLQTWQALWPGQDQQFEFLLFTAGQSEPYRRLILWLDVIE